ncbi:metalloprotease MEP1 [Aspergillus taichungensis]|uniref:Metalloprotease MEP1 n=1 Tax=Aspergillus taichungensis TaxID=482145 RepID=A0A2J5HLD6_9EURO|nr:metalloprotease MEP1 [Aspergillus taichungensis]
MGRLFFTLLITLSLILTDPRTKCWAFGFDQRGFCATGPPTEFLKKAHEDLSALELMHDSASESTDRQVTNQIEIDTWFHIICSEEDAELISDTMIASQLSHLQDAYRNASMSYRLKGVTRLVNDTWARNDDEIGMKSALRKGTYSTLNVYFQSDLHASSEGDGRSTSVPSERQSDISNQLSSSILGFCTMPDPSINSSTPRANYVKDGCNILAKTMPGGSLAHYNKGGTAIHEVGHWNGLLHIFEGESCSSRNKGDYVADTPQQSEATDGCPAQKDSCPNLPGVDAIHNFMDYSSDDCYEQFTPGQTKRMRSMWYAMREGK